MERHLRNNKYVYLLSLRAYILVIFFNKITEYILTKQKKIKKKAEVTKPKKLHNIDFLFSILPFRMGESEIIIKYSYGSKSKKKKKRVFGGSTDKGHRNSNTNSIFDGSGLDLPSYPFEIL